MENKIPFVAYPIFQAEKHPFQIDIDGFPNPRGAYQANRWGTIGFTIRMDMPGVPKDDLKISRKSDLMTITFSARAPKKEDFPFDESERVYAGFVQVNKQHRYSIPLISVGRNGCFLLLLPKSAGSLFFLPEPRFALPQITSGSVKSDKGEGSSSGISIAEEYERINLEPGNLETPSTSGSSNISSPKSKKGKAKQSEGSSSGKSQSHKPSSDKSTEEPAKTKQVGGSSSGKSQSPKTSPHKSTKGSAKPKQGDGSSSGKSVHKTGGSWTSELVDLISEMATEGSVKSDKGEGSSSGISIAEEYERINLEPGNLETPSTSGSSNISSPISKKGKAKQSEGSSSGKSQSHKPSSDKSTEEPAKTKQVGGSSSGKSQSPKTSPHKSTKGSAKPKQGDGSSSGKSIHKTGGSWTSELVDLISEMATEGLKKSERHEDCSEKSIDKAEASARPGSGKGSQQFQQDEDSSAKSMDKAEGSSYDDDEVWMHAWIKKNVYHLAVPKQTKEESLLAKASPTEQSTHEAPEIAIGSIEECTIHSPHCQCGCCDTYGVYLKTWSTTEDIIGYANYLKIKGPEALCEKRVIQEDGQYSVYVRADLPGLEPNLCIIVARDRCIIVHGKSQTKKNYMTGGRSYLFFVKLRCSCCRFYARMQNYEDGVLRMFCRIIRADLFAD